MASNELTVYQSTPDPMKEFLGIHELLVVMAETIDCTHELQNLCLVNRAFKAAFSRQLYRYLSFTVNANLPVRLYRLLQSEHLENVRELSFEVGMTGRQVIRVNYRLLLPLVVQLLHKTPLLRDFRWTHPSNVDMMRFVNYMAGQDGHCLPRLRRLCITSTRLLSPNLIRLPVSCNLARLTTLSLTKIRYDGSLTDPATFEKWLSNTVDDLVNILSSSPYLTSLELSMSKGYGFARKFLTTFPGICEKYHERGCAPLQLEVLNLGWGMMLLSKDEFGDAGYLRQLTRTESLTALHMTRNGVQHLPWEGEKGHMKMAWGTVSQQNTPSLVYLKIDQLDQAGCQYLYFEEMSSLLRSVYLHIESEDVFDETCYSIDYDSTEENDDPEYTSIINLFEDCCPSYLNPIQTKSLSIKVPFYVFKRKAPRNWLNLETLALESSWCSSDVSTFRSLADTFLSPHASIQELTLQFRIKDLTKRQFTRSPLVFDILEASVRKMAKTCKQLKKVQLSFYLWGTTPADSVLEDMYSWRIVRETRTIQDVGECGPEEEIPEITLVLVTEYGRIHH